MEIPENFITGNKSRTCCFVYALLIHVWRVKVREIFRKQRDVLDTVRNKKNNFFLCFVLYSNDYRNKKLDVLFSESSRLTLAFVIDQC